METNKHIHICMCMYVYVYIYNIDSMYSIMLWHKRRNRQRQRQRPPRLRRLRHLQPEDATARAWRPAASLVSLFKVPYFSPLVLYFMYRDPMWSSNPFHWCPWIRDIRFREPFGEKNKQMHECPPHEPECCQLVSTRRSGRGRGIGMEVFYGMEVWRYRGIEA